MRACAALLLAAASAALSACGAGSGGTRDADGPGARVERCVERLVGRADGEASDEEVRRYARDTYCARFEANGWIYADGALAIGAQTWLEEGASCAKGGEGEPTREVPCEELERDASGSRTLECALLHHVRRAEVRDYVEILRRDGPIRCDDGTPVEDIGVP